MEPETESPRILSEDAELLAVSKPAGLDVFASRHSRQESLWSWLRAARPELESVGDRGQPAIVHRLDRYTSGILLVARDPRTYRTLRRAFGASEISKDYLALVEGQVPESLEIDLPIGSRYRRSKTVSVALPGRRLRGVRPARTIVRPIASESGFTFCQVSIRSGVRHQIRAHLSHLGHPLAGDRDYRASMPVEQLKERFFLHAWKLNLPDLEHLSARELACPLPDDLAWVLRELRFIIKAKSALDGFVKA